jgi:hypothetical protein
MMSTNVILCSPLKVSDVVGVCSALAVMSGFQNSRP